MLDLSLRNNLLNYRPSQRRTISISGRKPKEIYELFVLHEKSLRFRAKTRSKKGRKTKTEEEDEASEKESRLLRTIGKILVSEEDRSQKEDNIRSSRSESFLETPDDNETLDKNTRFFSNNQ